MSQKIQQKILLVDDDKLVCEILALHLEDAGFVVITATSAKEALAILTSGKHLFSAAIIDRMMPNMDGTTLVKKMKANPAFSNIPVIMLTSGAERQDMREAVEGGVFDFLLKPVEKDLLFLVLKRAIRISEIGRH